MWVLLSKSSVCEASVKAGVLLLHAPKKKHGGVVWYVALLYLYQVVVERRYKCVGYLLRTREQAACVCVLGLLQRSLPARRHGLAPGDGRKWPPWRLGRRHDVATLLAEGLDFGAQALNLVCLQLAELL